jgi:hypothetical protein
MAGLVPAISFSERNSIDRVRSEHLLGEGDTLGHRHLADIGAVHGREPAR